MPKHIPILLLAFSLSAAHVTSASAQDSSPSGRARLPSAEEIARAQAKARESMGRVPQASSAQQDATPSMPKVDSLPKPATPTPDIATLAEKYKDLGRTAVQKQQKPDLLVMVSLSMPREALERVATQAENAGATLVFRGLKGDSMMKMGEEIKAILGNRNVASVVHPPAFQQFSVTQVPAVVLARPEAGNVLENGCSRMETFVKVTGDVSLDYALEYIERKSPNWAAIARDFRAKIVRRID